MSIANDPLFDDPAFVAVASDSDEREIDSRVVRLPMLAFMPPAPRTTVKAATEAVRADVLAIPA